LADREYIAAVRRAQAGDSRAFTDLVAHFQDMAVGSAYSWLGDIELAREVSQEAFFEAHLNLHQLRSAAAFPGWFRRIVFKQCDRVSRRKSLMSTSLETAGQLASDGQTPEYAVQLNQQREHLRLAVEALPEEQRVVVSLHYFAGVTGNAISEFLEMPLSSVKKRLRDARKRLFKEGEQLMQETIDNLRPSKSESFSREIAFFIALRQGDLEEVKRLIAGCAELVNARQNWNSELVISGVLPFSSKATALITAIEMNNLEMQTLLLRAGADVDGRCGCETGESPIWAATLLNRVNHARQLLDQGCDPNVYSASGNTPLHVAAMRGSTDLAGLLLDHGADADAMDRSTNPIKPLTPAFTGKHKGRTPRDWAIANGHTRLARMLQEKSNGGDDHQTLPGIKKQVLNQGPVFHTGIKALDFFTPLPRGGLTRLPFQAGVGMLVLLAELSHRFFSLHKGSVIWTGFTHPPFDINDWEAEMSEFGLKDHIEHSLASFREDTSTRREAYATGILMAETLRDEGREVLAIVQSTGGFEHDIEESLHRLSRESDHGSITTIVITPWKKEPWVELKAPYSAQITLDRKRANRNLFPAINPSLSLSRAMMQTGRRHSNLLARVKTLLDWYGDIDPEFDMTVPETQHPDGVRIRRAHALLAYFCQPFVITEPFSGHPGEQVAPDRLLEDIESILESSE
jgi:RNA polymerase sigma factor (sigma-70 family)